MENETMIPAHILDFVEEAEAAMAAGETFGVEQMQEVTIKFGKGLMGEPFMSKNGNELVEIRIPNTEPGDSRPWESFVISPKMVHENQFGKGLWMKLPENGTTRLARNVKQGKDENGKNIWKTEYRTISNGELKSLLEAYKTRDSLLGKLSEKKEAVDSTPKKSTKSKAKMQEESL